MRRGGGSRIYQYILHLAQHASASHCRHQWVVVTSEATEAVCIVDVRVYGPSVYSALYTLAYVPRQLTTLDGL
jgi:hypothetical protein